MPGKTPRVPGYRRHTSGQARVTLDGKEQDLAVADYNGDGLPDIFVANDKLFNSLFHNKGHAQFDEVAFETGVALPEQGNLISGMGVDFRDLNNDGYLDATEAAAVPWLQKSFSQADTDHNGKIGKDEFRSAQSAQPK